MKEMVKEIVTHNTRTVFVAHDGTEFKDKDECIAYEESALGVLTKRFEIHKIDTKTCICGIDIFFDDGMECSDYYKLSLETEEEKTAFLQMIELYQTRKGYYLRYSGCSDSFTPLTSKVDSIKLHTVYILQISDERENIGLFSKEDFLANFNKAWDLAIKD